MQRSRFETEKRLIEAVGQLITEDGFEQIGINRIASRSGINKILIYRYFGGLEGLLEAYFERTRPIVSAPPIDVNRLKDAPLEEFFDTCCNYLIEEFRLLRQNVQAQEFLKADLMSSEGLPSPIADQKEAQLRKTIDELSEIISTKNGRPFAAICYSALTLLTFMSQQKRLLLGLDLSSDEGWLQIESTMKGIFHGAYLLTKERLNASGSKPT